MNVQEYISSGIIETCVLGLTSKEEMSEFEHMCATYSEVRTAREAFELSLERSILANPVEPPASLKSKIFAEIEIEAAQRQKEASPPVLPVQTQRPAIRAGWIRYVTAASILLLIASTALNFYFFSQYKEYISKYDQLIASQTQVALVNQSLQTKLNEYSSALSLIKDPAMAVIKMPGTHTYPASLATIYWDTRSRDVYLLVNNLPKPAVDKQYQLWALVDGKPVDAGVFDIKEGLSFAKMKNIPKAQGFAITLEKKGGSASPTMHAMYTLGKVTG